LRKSDSVLAGPLASSRLVPGTVSLVDVGNLGHQRVVRVGICEHRADGKENLGDCESRAPLVPQDVQTDAAVRVDVGVVDTSGEVDLWGLEGVVGGEVNVEEEDASGVWRVTWTHDSCLPVEQILSERASRAGRGRVTAQVSKFLVDSLKSHGV
jgi:hypothetical protein